MQILLIDPKLKAWTVKKSRPGWSIANKYTNKFVNVRNNAIVLENQTIPFEWSIICQPNQPNQQYFCSIYIPGHSPPAPALTLDISLNSATIILKPFSSNPDQRWILKRFGQ